MTYKGYIGVARFDDEANVIRGQVVNTRDTITFQGKSVDEAKAAFRDSVDDYLEFCESSGEAPEKPFSGRILLRVGPELHRDLMAIAWSENVSVNRLVCRELARIAGRDDSALKPKRTKSLSSHQPLATRPGKPPRKKRTKPAVE
jgi:predicted HicB family RNase H-like nuclease